MLVTFESNAGRQTCVTYQAPLVRTPRGGFYFGRSIFLILLCSVFGAFNREPYDRWGGTAILSVFLRGWPQGSVANPFDVVCPRMILVANEYATQAPHVIVRRDSLRRWAGASNAPGAVIVAASNRSGIGCPTGCFGKPCRAVLVARADPAEVPIWLILPADGAVGDVFIVATAFVVIHLDVIDLDPVAIPANIVCEAVCADARNAYASAAAHGAVP